MRKTMSFFNPRLLQRGKSDIAAVLFCLIALLMPFAGAGKIFGASVVYSVKVVSADPPPAAITNLSALAEAGGDVKLDWTAPGENGVSGNIINGKFKIKYATYSVSDWESGTWTDEENKYSIEWTTSCSPGSGHIKTIGGLRQGVEYYFRAWTMDAGDNWSLISNASMATPAVVTGAQIDGGAWDGADLVPNDGDTLNGTFTNVGEFRINTGYTVDIKAGVKCEIFAGTITINGTLNGNKKGLTGGAGGAKSPGSSGDGADGGQGGGNGSSAANATVLIHGAGGGGAGGSGNTGAAGGLGEVGNPGGDGGAELGDSYGYAVYQGGGAGGGGGGGEIDGNTGTGGSAGERGGGSIILYSSGNITVSGTINADGGQGGHGGRGSDEPMFGANGGGGGAGASGGQILFDAVLTLNLDGASITANGGPRGVGGVGGNGMADGASGENGSYGTGGRLKFFYTSISSVSSVIEVDDGDPTSDPGLDGTINYNKKPSTPVLVSPADVAFTSAHPAFDWNDATDADGPDDDSDTGDDGTVVAGLSYEIYISSTQDFSVMTKSSITAAGDTNYPCEAGLTDGVTYYWKVRTKDDTSWGAWSPWKSFIVGDSIAPDGISNLTALQGQAEGEVELSWTAPGGDGTEGNVSGYLVKYSTSRIDAADYYSSWVSTFNHLWTGIAGAGLTEQRTVTGLTIETTYWFAVKGYDSSGHYGVWNSSKDDSGINRSNFCFVNIVPGRITTLTAIAGVEDDEVSLNWISPGDDGYTGTITSGEFRIEYSSWTDVVWSTSTVQGDGYYVELSTSNVIAGSGHNHTISGLQLNTTYYFRMWASDERGNWGELSNGVTFFIPALLPQDTSLVEVNISSISVGWASNQYADSYIVQAATETGFNTISASTTTTDVNYSTLTLTGLIKNSTYYIRAGLLQPGTTGWMESPAYITAVTLCEEPGTPNIDVVYQSSVTVSWTDVEAVGYIVQASTEGAFNVVSCSSETSNGDLEQLTVENLLGNTTYYIRVGALNWGGSANYASAGSTATPVGMPVIICLTHTDGNWSNINIASFTCSGCDNYRYVFNNTAVDDADVGDTAWDGGQIGFTMDAEDDWYLHVAGYNSVGTEQGQDDFGPIKLDTTPPQGINAVSLIAGASYYVTVLSTATDVLSGVGSYYFNELTGNSGASDSIWQSGNSFIDDGLTANTSYTYRVQAKDLAGNESTWSSELSTWTLANPPLSLSITASGTDYAVLSWTVNSNPAWTRYGVSKSSDNFLIAIDTIVVLSDGFTGNTTTAYELNMGATYWFRVWAWNERDVATAYAVSASTHIKINSPEVVGFDLVNISSLTLSWSVISQAAGYIVEGSTDSNFTIIEGSSKTMNNNLTQLNIPDLNVNTTYYARVGSLSSGVTFWMSNPGYISTVTLANIPGAAVESFPGVNASSITAVWTAGMPANPDGTLYEVYASSTDFNGKGIEYSSGTLNISAGLEGLDYNTTYYLRVRAVNHRGIASSYLNMGSTVTLCEEPGTFEISAVNKSSVTMTWGDIRSVGYILEAAEDTGFSVGLISSYTANGDLTHLSAQGLSFNTTYYMRVAGYNWQGVKTYSQVVTSPTLCEAPGSPAIDTVYSSSVTVSWSDVDAAGYRVDASTASDFSVINGSSQTSNGDLIQMTVENLVGNTTYYFRISAKNWADVKTYSLAGSTVTRAGVPVITCLSHTAGEWTDNAIAGFTCSGSDNFKYVFNQVHDDDADAGDTAWSGGFLGLHLTAPGDWYLHVVGYNAGAVELGQDDFGPIRLDTIAPAGITVLSLVPGASYYVTVVSTATDSLSGMDGYYFEELTGNSGGSDSGWQSANSYTDSGLTPNTSYTYRVKARDVVGNESGWSSKISTWTLANPPLSLSVTGSGTYYALLQWQANGNPSGTRYGISKSSDNFALSIDTVVALGDGLTDNVATLTGLELDTTYWFRVWAWNGLGVETDYNVSDSTYISVSPPYNVSYETVNISSMSLSWSAVAGAAGYLMQVSEVNDFSSIEVSTKTLNASCVTLAAAGLSANTTYYGRVGSIMGDTTVWMTSPVYLSTPTLASIPSLAADTYLTVNKSSVAIAWQAGTPSNPSGTMYNVMLSSTDFDGTGQEYSSSTLKVNAVLEDLQTNTTYYARVRAKNCQNIWSAYLNLGTTVTLCEIPGSLTVSSVYKSSATLNWTDVNSAGYILEAAEDAGFTTGFVSSQTSNGDNITLSVESLNANTTYYFRTAALNWRGIRAYSETRSTVTLCESPLSPSIDTMYISSAIVSWTGISAEGYIVQASTDSGFSVISISSATPDGASTHLLIENLLGGTAYFIRIGALNRINVVTFSVTVATKTPSTSLPPNAITDLKASYGIHDGEIDLSWTAVGADGMMGQADSYEIKYATYTITDFSSSDIFLWSSRSVDVAAGVRDLERVTGLTAGSTYYFQIRVYDAQGNYNNSEVINAAAALVAPGQVTPFTAVSGSEEGEIELSWTAPGDDATEGDIINGAYIIRWSTWSVDDWTSGLWSDYQNKYVLRIDTDTASGESSRITISGLRSAVEYYFKIWCEDDIGNVSQASSEAIAYGADKTSPEVVSIDPVNKAIITNLTSNIQILFSEGLDVSSLSDAVLIHAVRDYRGNTINETVSGGISYTGSQNKLLFVPAGLWDCNYTYSITLSSSIKDDFGNYITTTSVSYFSVYMNKDTENVIVEQDDGRDILQIDIPAGTLTDDAYVNISSYPHISTGSVVSSKIATANSKMETLGDGYKYPIPSTYRKINVYDLSGSVLKVNKQVTLRIPYNESGTGLISDVDDKINENTLKAYYLDEDRSIWVKVADSSVDTDNNRVVATVPHLSVFVLMGASSYDLSEAYAYPVPFKPTSDTNHTNITFTNLSTEAVIKIYSVSGRLVKELYERDGDYVYTWDGKADGRYLPSGVYIYVIKNPRSVKKGKLMIIK